MTKYPTPKSWTAVSKLLDSKPAPLDWDWQNREERKKPLWFWNETVQSNFWINDYQDLLTWYKHLPH